MVSATKGGSPQGWSTLPEVVPTGSAPELVVHTYPEVSEKGFSPIFMSPISKYADSPAVPVQPPIELPTNPARWRWLRRRRNQVILGAIILAAAIAIAVGVGVSLTQNKTDGSTPTPSSTPNANESSAQSIFGQPMTFPTSGRSQPSVCEMSICPQAITAARTILTTDLSPTDNSTGTGTNKTDTIFLFALGTDSAIWYRQIVLLGAPGSPSATHAWKTTTWQSLGGSFVSAPSAAEMRVGRIEVFAIASDGTTRVRTWQNGIWSSTWKDLSGNAGLPPTSCSYLKDNMNVVIVGVDHAVYHKYANGNGGDYGPSIDGHWEEQYGWVGSNVDIGCINLSGGVQRFDMVGYGRGDNNGSNSAPSARDGIMFKRFNTTHNWDRVWSVVPGKFRGDPTVLALETGMHYFGLVDESVAYHMHWSPEEGTQLLVKLGGNKFLSAVTGVSPTQEGDKLHIFAVGTDARLKTKARVGTRWGEQWKDLGGFFNSAPKPIMLNDTSLAVFGIGPQGDMIHGVFTMGTKDGWEGGWFSDGGEFSTKWKRLGSE